MISQARAQQIREQEELRFAIQKEIEKRYAEPKTRLSRVLAFLNTSVGAFVLSTILVGLFSYSQNQIAAASARSAERQERQRKIRLEIANRLDEISRMSERFDAHYYSVVRTAFDGFRPGDTVNESHKIYYAGMFPELRARTLKSLVYELGELSADESERKRIQTLVPSVKTLRGYYDRLLFVALPAGPNTPNGLPIELYYLEKADAEKFQTTMNMFTTIQPHG